MYPPIKFPSDLNFEDCRLAKHLIGLILERLMTLRSLALGDQASGKQVSPEEVTRVSEWIEQNVALRSYTETELAEIRATVPPHVYQAHAGKMVLTETSYWMAVDFGFLFGEAINSELEGCSWGCLKSRGKLNVLRNHPVLFNPGKTDSFPPLQVGHVLAGKIAERGLRDAKVEETLMLWIKAFSRSKT